MIPKKIHYVWFGKGQMNTTLKNCLASWEKHLPDYKIICWNENNSPLDYPFMNQLIRHKKWALISDYLRLHVLYNEGGIYLDTDVEIIKSLDPLLENDCFLGFQQEEPSGHWVNCSIMGAVKGHPYMEECLEVFNQSQQKDLTPLVGADISTLVLRNHGLSHYGNQELDNVKLYKHEYFYPYHFTESMSKDHVKKDTYCIHHWQISWKGKKGIGAKITMLRYKFSRLLTILFNIK